MNHSRRTTSIRTLLGLGALALFLSGCTSPAAYRQAISDRDAEIRQLREERTSLKRDRRGLQEQVSELEARLAEEAARLAVEPIPAAAPTGFPELDELGIGYGMRNGNLVISIPSSITFGSGKAQLSTEGRSALNTVARTLRKEYSGGIYYIEGHTDSDPIRKSSFKSNRDLSLARATAVHTFLVEECEVADEQCVVVGHGQYAPVAPNDSNENKARNRRVEIVVHQ